MSPTELLLLLQNRFAEGLQTAVCAHEEVTIEISADQLKTICLALRDEPDFSFNQLIDVAGVDYSLYGQADWVTQSSTATGFERGVESHIEKGTLWKNPRFAVVYHLLSLSKNHRLRIRCFVDEKTLMLPSLTEIWPSADWFEREAFDLFGFIFEDHADMRRILTDYGFVGHPFRKDFPLSGEVEVHYDAEKKQVVYGPVEIEPRVLVPRVIRHDNSRLISNKEKGE